MVKRKICESPSPILKKIRIEEKFSPIKSNINTENLIEKSILEVNNLRPKIICMECPNIENIKDLIIIGKTGKLYKNINMLLLWQILPHLIELNSMIGMETLKESIFYQILYYLQNMQENNKNEEYLHTIILGKPGCGKTTIAKILGNIYKSLDILSTNAKFKLATRENFIAEYLGQTTIKTKKLLNSCIGGILFIDEVYSLGSSKTGGGDSYSKEAIDTICAFLSEHKNDFCCIIAGYEEQVKSCFLSMNPGLERRFPWVHKIEEYNNNDLADIFIKMINDIKWNLEDDITREYISKIFNTNKDLFKNSGGDVETFISKIKIVHSKRIFGMSKNNRFLITKEDINNAIKMKKKYLINKKNEYNMYI